MGIAVKILCGWLVLMVFGGIIGVVCGLISDLLKAPAKKRLRIYKEHERAGEESRRLMLIKEADERERQRKEREWREMERIEKKEFTQREMKADPEKLCDKELVNACEYVRRELRHNPESSLLKDRLNEIWAEVEKRVRLDKLAKSDEETRANIAVIAEDINAIRMKRDK